MKYSYEYKKECVELYKKGKWPETPEGIKTKHFHKTVRMWVRLEEIHGPEVLKGTKNKKWSTDEKLEIVTKMLSGRSGKSVSIEYGINSSEIYAWLNKYKKYGYNGLENNFIEEEQPEKMKKSPEHKAKELSTSEREEYLNLKAEVEYLRAENEVIKKEIALRQKRYAAQLKAKKQR